MGYKTLIGSDKYRINRKPQDVFFYTRAATDDLKLRVVLGCSLSRKVTSRRSEFESHRLAILFPRVESDIDYKQSSTSRISALQTFSSSLANLFIIIAAFGGY